MADPASQSLLVAINSFRFVLDLRRPLNSGEVLPDEFKSFHQQDRKHRDGGTLLNSWPTWPIRR